MAHWYQAQDITDGWLHGIEYLIGIGGTDAQLCIQIETPQEDPDVCQALDVFCLAHPNGRLARIDRVADTIFPAGFYHGEPGIKARERLYATYRQASIVAHRFIGDSYFDRMMIDWAYRDSEGLETTCPLLEHQITRLKTYWDHGNRTVHLTEFTFSTGLPEDNIDIETPSHDIGIFNPMKDKGVQGFPCLSHISLTISHGLLNLTAVYRNQHFLAKAYGNFVGLSRLLDFVSTEVGCPRGSLLCVAAHADAELQTKGVPKREILALVQNCRTRYDATHTKVGT